MIKKDRFLEFLFLFAKADIVPFNGLEDFFGKNYNAINNPFFAFDHEIQALYKSFKAEFSDNMSMLGPKKRFWYINSLKDKIRSETYAFDKKELIDYLLTLGVKTEDLDYNNNTKLKDLLHENVILDTDKVDFEKSIKVIRLYYKYLLNVKRDEILNYINDLIEYPDNNSTSPEDKSKKEVWFKVGLLFAKGEMNKYFNSSKTSFIKGYSAPKVAKEIGYDNYEKFILATINNYSLDNTNANKNIYNSKDKMDKIIQHCKEHQITVDEYFISRLPKE